MYYAGITFRYNFIGITYRNYREVVSYYLTAEQSYLGKPVVKRDHIWQHGLLNFGSRHKRVTRCLVIQTIDR